MAETDPYQPGVFYTGEFIISEFFQGYSEIGLDRRVAILAEISAKPQVSQLMMYHSPSVREDPANIGATFHFYYVDTAGNLVGRTTPMEFADKTDEWLNIPHGPTYIAIKDFIGSTHYLTSQLTNPPTLSSSSASPGLPDITRQEVGHYIEFIGENGQDIYWLTVTPGDEIEITLMRTEPERNAILRVSNGHPFAYDGQFFWIEGMVSLGDISTELEEIGGGYGGVVTPRISSLSIQLADEYFAYLISQSWDTRDVQISIGLSDQDISQYRVILRARTERAEADENAITITLRDTSVLFDKSIHLHSYGGSGGYDGTEDQAGILKPLLYGFCRHFTPRFVNSSINLYQIHDGPIHAIQAVHTGGALLTNLGNLADLTAWNPTQPEVDAGGYKTDYVQGCFRLAAPASAAITVSAWGHTGIPVGTSRIGEICRVIIEDRVDNLEINQNSFDRYHVNQSGGAGIYLDEDISVREVLNRLIGPVGAAINVNSLSRISIEQIRSRTPVALIEDANVAVEASVHRRQPPRAGSVYRIGGSRAYTVLSETDFLDNSSVNVRNFLKSEFRYREYVWTGPDKLRLPVYDSAGDVVHDTALDNFSFMAQAAVRLAYRDHTLQNVYGVTVVGYDFIIHVADTVLFHVQKLGVRNLKTGIVIGVTEKSPTGAHESQTELLIWAG